MTQYFAAVILLSENKGLHAPEFSDKRKNLLIMTNTNLLSTQDAARYLGVKVSYLYKLMMRRVIAYYKPGGKICYFKQEDLDTYLNSVRVATQAELDTQAARVCYGLSKSTKR